MSLVICGLSPLMTRVRCSVEPSKDTASILRGCEMALGLAMVVSERVRMAVMKGDDED